MLTQLFLAALTITAPQAPEPKALCSFDRRGYCTDRVLHYTLTFNDKDPAIGINTAIGIGTTIELPPNVKLLRKPYLSNKAMFSLGREKDWEDHEKRRVFDVSVTAPNKAPKNFDMKSLINKTVRLELALDVGITLTVRLRIVDAEPERSVVRLVLDFPELAEQEEWAQSRVKKLVAQWQSEYERRKVALDKEVAERVPYERARDKLAHDECRKLSESGESDHVIAITEKICREGGTLELHFRVINRGHHAFVVGNVFISPSGEGASGYLLRHSEAERTSTSKTVSLGYNKEAHGIAWWPVDAGSPLELQISEGITKGRVIRVDKIKY